MAKNKPINLDEITQEEKLKYEIAEELGLLDKVLSEGWRSLSAKMCIRDRYNYRDIEKLGKEEALAKMKAQKGEDQE